MKIVLCVFTLLFTLTINAKTPGRFTLLDLMEDATPVTETYTIRSLIDTDYKVLSIKPYHYSVSRKEITEHPSIETVSNNFLSLTFDQEPSEDEYLVLHITYGPKFIFERNSEALCWFKFAGKQIFDNIRCDSYTTALYLVASAIVDEDPLSKELDLLTPERLDQAIEYQSLPKLQSFQNYVALITFLLNHVAENPEYMYFSLPGNYLPMASQFTHELTRLLQTRRRIKIVEYETLLNSIDESMTNIGFRIFTALNSTINRNRHTLDLIEKHPTYTNNFYQGLQPFTLVEPESFTLADVEFSDGQITFKKWPWFHDVEVSFDDSSPITLSGTSHAIPLGSSEITLQPKGLRGSFAKTKIDLTGLVDAAPTEIVSNE